jgi:hypothetical protein
VQQTPQKPEWERFAIGCAYVPEGACRKAHCNPFFSSSPALRKPAWTGSREASNRWNLLSRLSRGTFTTWKLPTRLSFFKKLIKIKKNKIAVLYAT